MALMLHVIHKYCIEKNPFQLLLECPCLSAFTDKVHIRLLGITKQSDST